MRGARVAAIVSTGVLVVLAVAELLYGWFGPPNWRANTGDLTIYTDATRRLLSGGSWYLERQLAGPYGIAFGDVLYPPVTALFFAAWLVLPGWTFVAIPVAITAWCVLHLRPAWWVWPLIGLCLVWPMTTFKAVSANPGVWTMAALALGALYRWPAGFALVKVTFAPLALIGIRSRAWWLVAGALAAGSLLFFDASLAYPRVLLDSRNPDGWLYSLADLPMQLIPILALVAQQRPQDVDAAEQRGPERRVPLRRGEGGELGRRLRSEGT